MASDPGTRRRAIPRPRARFWPGPAGRPDGFGHRFPGTPLAPPCCGVKVTGVLFHSQGRLVIDGQARVVRADGTSFPNLYAAGGRFAVFRDRAMRGMSRATEC
jgi:hypothetical protein